MSETEAATKIQAAYRGFQIRQLYPKKKNKSKKSNQEDSSTTAYSNSSIYDKQKDPKLNPQKHMESYEEIENNEKPITSLDPNLAAIRIQALYKGHKVRKDYRLLSNSNKENKEISMNPDQAATKIQAVFKGYKTRKELANVNN
ncbi:abnormal spindle-like microcephaly-associated protein homolog [Gordionus sp. m RMFG-2023]|uniref:abnormal spindle-like microcephaly-associated protein homolog n=1 Tax=Gordionus sp. m RMFG-2023 TaxID=3053472 RepID=UPI0031FCAA52